MKLREARKKIFGQGPLAIHGGGPKFFWMGGTGLDGGGQPLHGVWFPPSPPMLGTPAVYCHIYEHFVLLLNFI